MARRTTITVDGKPVYEKKKTITNRRLTRLPGGGNITGFAGPERGVRSKTQLYQGTWNGMKPTIQSETNRLPSQTPHIGTDQARGLPGYMPSKIDGLAYMGAKKKPLTDREKAERAANEAKRKQEASKKSALGYFDQAGKRMASREQDVRNLTQKSLGYYEPMINELAGKGDLISDKDKRRMIANRKAEIAAQAQNLASGFSDIDSGVTAGRRMNLFRNAGLQSALLPIQTELDVRTANREDFYNRLNQRRGLASSMAGITGDLATRLGYFNQNDLSLAGGKADVQMGYQYDPGSQYFNQLGQAEGRGGGGGGLFYFNPVKAGGNSGIHYDVSGNQKEKKKKSRDRNYINDEGDIVFANNPLKRSGISYLGR